MARYSGLPYVQARNHGGSRTLTQMVVIHCTANTASAANEAAYASRRTDGVSAHFYADGTQVIQTLDTAVVAYGCYPSGNSRSVQFELCGLPNQISDATMRRAAPVVARVCAEFGIPIRKIEPEHLLVGARGICGHGDVTRAWGEGDHTDPGDAFPWATFISYIQAAGGGAMSDWDERMTIEGTERTMRSWLGQIWGMARDCKARLDQVLAGIAELKDRPGAPITDAQIQAIADRVSERVSGTVADEIARRMRE